MPYSQKNFEKALKVGESVLVRWRCHEGSFSGPATVSKINRSSIQVKLAAKVASFPEGHQVAVPLSGTGRWTSSECVLPLSLAGDARRG